MPPDPLRTHAWPSSRRTARPPGPAPAARPRGQPGHTCAGVPSPRRAWTRFHRFPNIDFASKLIRKIIPGQTKQNKTKNLAMFLGLTYDSRQSGAAAGRALGWQGRTARGRRRPRRPGPHGDRVPRSKGKPQTGGHRADALGRLVTPRHARPGPRESGVRGPAASEEPWVDLHPAPIPATAGTSALGTGVASGPSESRRCICPGDGGANSCCGGHTGAAGTRRQRAASSACRSGPERGLQARPVLRTLAPAWEQKAPRFRRRVRASAPGGCSPAPAFLQGRRPGW